MTPTQERTRRSLIGATATRDEKRQAHRAIPAVTVLREAIAEAQRSQGAVPHIPQGFTEPTSYLKRQAASLRTLTLDSTTVAVGRDGKISVGSAANSAGEQITIAESIFRNSRAAQAGMGIELWPHLEPVHIETGSETKVMAMVKQPKAFAVVNPAELSLIPDDDDMTVSDLPLFLASIDRDNQKSYGVTYKLSRRQQKMRGEEQTAAEVLTAIFTGLSRIVDKLALEAILANTPENFTLAKAAAAGVRFADLRAMIGTAGTGAMVRQDGQLVAAGVPGELTNVTTQTVIGQFDRALAMLGTDMSVLVNRLNTNGDMTISAWLSVDAVAPDAGRFWTVGA